MGSDVMKKFTDTVMQSLEEAEGKETLSWVRPWRSIDCAYRNAFTGHKYSGIHNILTILLQNRSDCRYVTFNQIRKAKGKLKAGSKATHLIAWKISQKEDEETGKKKNLIFSRSVCVFNVEDTENLNLKPLNIGIIDESIKSNEVVEELIKKHKVKVHNKPSNQAFYSPTTDEISMPVAGQFKTSDEHSATLLHELIHWTSKRVDRDCKNYGFDIEERAMEELVAELGAMFLCMNLKIDGYMDKNNLAYIKSWRNAAKGKNGERFLYKACSLAEKACKFILGDKLNNSGDVEPDIKENAA